MKEIKLTQGQVALVDDDNFEVLNQFKWCAQKHRNTYYAIRTILVNDKNKTIRMHNVIMGGKGVDHINRNGLNDQRSNLRFCTNSQNHMNRRKRKNTSSIYKGVSFHKRTGKWMASIGINDKKIHLGYFDIEVEAAKSYNNKAIELFGEFANLNNV